MSAGGAAGGAVGAAAGGSAGGSAGGGSLVGGASAAGSCSLTLVSSASRREASASCSLRVADRRSHAAASSSSPFALARYTAYPKAWADLSASWRTRKISRRNRPSSMASCAARPARFSSTCSLSKKLIHPPGVNRV
ncbi:MAG: hypothetical protein C0497_01750 [Gemmatimonas sp.]|nr:hypothetical protein [Gemmatimonas sp.]